MAIHQKNRILKREFDQLDQQEKDYIEDLTYSLLEIQNAELPQKSEEQENQKEKNEE
jgi:hypothetical protein